MLAQLEPVIGFFQFDHLAVSRVKSAIGESILIREKGFLLRGVKALVGLLIKLAGGVELGEDRLHKLLVLGLSGADKIVVGQLELFYERLPVRGEFIAVS